jgi:DNA polymerase-3 subunit beta
MTINHPTVTGLFRDVAGLAFTAAHGALLSGLAVVGCAVSREPTVPILGAVQIQPTDHGILLSATDHELSVTARVPAAVHATGPMLVVSHAELVKLLAAFTKGIRKAGGASLPVTIRADRTDETAEDIAVVEAAGYTVPVTRYPIEHVPRLPDLATTPIRLPCGLLARQTLRVLTAIGTDPQYPDHHGLTVQVGPDTVRLAATDRFRLTVADLPHACQSGVQTGAVVPGARLGAALKHLVGEHVDLGFDCTDQPDLVTVRSTDVTISLRTFATPPPGYYQKILEQPVAGYLRTNRAALVTATERAAAVLAAKGHRSGTVTLRTSPDSITVTPDLPDHPGNVTAPSQPADTDDALESEARHLTVRLLLDALTSITTDTITLGLPTAAHRPLLFTDTSASPVAYRHLLMPARP